MSGQLVEQELGISHEVEFTFRAKQAKIARREAENTPLSTGFVFF